MQAHLDEQVHERILKIPAVKMAKPISPEEVRKRFGERIREIRRKKGVSQEDLALACDVDRAFLGGVERGERNISLLNIYKIARGLKVPARELMP
ncbi:MAG TPA: helix-turn-helix transcriptional regulator [Terracidiphilus sp.]|nr:helix-turn-helix transcriptional regulator [Terracidiphilus sp.]